MSIKEWVRDRLIPLSIAAASAAAGLTWGFGGKKIILLLDPTSTLLSSETSPSTVTGSDLVADLLTISALTISVCIAYICLPRDRVEVKLATITKVHLHKELIPIKSFEEFRENTDADARSHYCDFIYGMLNPRDGLGGWYHLSDNEMVRTLGQRLWTKLKKFVDEHLDEQWIRVLIYGLCVAMAFGFFDLGLRFFGATKKHYDGFETGTIVFMLIMNCGTAANILALAAGTHSGEKETISAIAVAVDEIKKSIRVYQKHKTDLEVSRIEAAVVASGN